MQTVGVSKSLTRSVTSVLVFGAGGLFPAVCEGVDQLDWQDANAWTCAKTVAIHPPKVTGEFKGKQPAAAYARRFADGLANVLRQRLGEESVVVVAGSEPVTADLIIEGEFVALTTGSRAARFWVGFGAGKSWADLRMRCKRSTTGTPVFTLRHERGSAMGLKEDEIMENVDEVTHDVSSALGHVAGACDQATWNRTGVPAGDQAPVPATAESRDSVVPVAIRTQPDGAEVYIDGGFVGTSPLEELHLKAGSHTLEIRKKGFQTWTKTLSVLPESPTRLDVELEQDKPAAQTTP